MEKLSDFSLHLLSGFFVGELFLADGGLEGDVISNQVSGWHEMVVVHELNERLDLGSSLDFLLAHSLGYSQSISLNTSY